MRRLLLTGLTLSILASACDDGGGGGDDKPVEPEVIEEQPAPIAEPPAVVGPMDLKTLKLAEVNLGYKGDFRVKKVKRDEAGNFYVALVTEIKDGILSKGPGYALVKFNVKGEEIWRFPTSLNSSSSDVSEESLQGFLLGNLADIEVTPSGDILLIGTRAAGEPVTAASGVANFGRLSWALDVKTGPATVEAANRSNIVFLYSIAGAGTDKDSPTVVNFERLATPSWWTPRAIWFDTKDNTVVVESSSDSGSKVGVVQQVQKLTPTFSGVLASACYVAAGTHVSSGAKRLVATVAGAPASMIATMSAPLKKTFQDAAPAEPVTVESLKNAITAASLADVGHCWDMVGSKVMDPADASYKIRVPRAQVDTERLVFEVDSLMDILQGADGFESYDITLDGVGGRPNWAPLVGELPTMAAESGFATWKAYGDELVHVGFNTEGLQEKHLWIGNGRQVAERFWFRPLLSRTSRAPASIDLLAMSGNGPLVAAWTDRHVFGETNEGNRGLVLAKREGDEIVRAEFEVPAETGYKSFSSVALSDDGAGRLVVFATVGTQVPKTPLNGEIAAGTLVIGVTQ